MSERVAVVTGGNRGLGREVCRQLAREGIQVVLTARVKASAEREANALADEGLPVRGARLDVTSEEDASALAEQLDHVDVLVNNAGVTVSGFSPDSVRQTLAVNVHGVCRVTDALLPKLRERARVVNVSSGMGELSGFTRALRERFLGVEQRPEVAGLIREFQSVVDDGSWKEAGWPTSAYRVSKAALNALTRVQAKAHPGWRVNAVCPGWVRTDMGGSGAPRDVQAGAASITWAALLDDDGPTGGFYRDGHRIDW
jgi:NAD(P)-dependent dehydrogenase (short-subunit alcohol dehydrogenase family)